MARQDNIQAAPTEGLGQRVTFGFDTSGAPLLPSGGYVAANSGMQSSGPGSQVRGGDSGVGQLRDNGLFDTLSKFAGEAYGKAVRQKQTQAFFSGMQRAMQGEAIANIAKEQPWYSTLFGESDVVEGARAYTASAKAQEATAALEDNMSELRKLGPEDAQQEFMKAINGVQTGDLATDSSVLMTFTRTMPALMRRQTKEHWGWKQEQAVSAESSAFQAGASLLQNAGKGLADGTVTPDEYAGVVENFKTSIVPAYGRDEKGYKENMTDNLAQWAAQGKFHALNALTDSGFMDVLSADQQSRVSRAQEAGEARTKSRYSFDYSTDMAQIKALAEKPDVGSTTKDLEDRIDVLNNRYQQTTGSKSWLIGPEERAGYLSRNAVAISREVDRQYEKGMAAAGSAATDAQKELAEQTKMNTLVVAAGRGDLGLVRGATRDEKNKVAEDMYAGMSQPDKVKFLVRNMSSDYVIDTVKAKLNGSITAALSSGQIDQTWQKAFDGYAALREANPAVADAYYSDHKHRLEGFYNDVKSGLTTEGSFRRWFTGPTARVNLSKDDAKRTMDAINSEFNSIWPEWLGGEAKLKPGQAYRIMSEIGPGAEKMAAATNGDIRLAVNREIRAAKQNGLEVAGGYAWVNAKGQPSLQQYLTGPNGPNPVGVDKVSDLFDQAIHWSLYGGMGNQGILDEEANDVYVGRLPDLEGVPQFHVQAILKSGETKDAVLSGKDIYKYAEKRRTNVLPKPALVIR